MTNDTINKCYQGYYEGERFVPVDKFCDSYSSIRSRSSKANHRQVAAANLKPKLRTAKKSSTGEFKYEAKNSTQHLLSFSLTKYYKNLSGVITLSAFIVTLLLMMKFWAI